VSSEPEPFNPSALLGELTRMLGGVDPAHPDLDALVAVSNALATIARCLSSENDSGAAVIPIRGRNRHR
jgi:hypothetical protein